MSAAAEQKVKKLARLPGNVVCANCGTSKQFGHSTVCIKFFTFVCSNCKSSHQAISHRCKSLTMSSWTDAEVAELEAKGNDYARNTWLKNAPPVGSGGRPKEGDHIDVFKRFVVDVYEHKKYYGDYSGPPPVAAPQHVATAIPISLPGSVPAPSRRTPHFSKPPVAAPAPKAPAADLLDFAAAPAPTSFQADFDAFAPARPPPSTSSNGFQADFATFATPAPAPAPTSNASAFGFISQSAPPATSDPPSSAFAFISNPPASNPAPSSKSDFADFAGLTITSPTPVAAPAPTLPKKPVMSANQKGSLISSLDNISMPPKPQMTFGGTMPQQVAFGGMPSNQMMHQQQPGYGGMNSTTMMQQQQMMMMQQQRMAMQQQNMGAMNNMGIMNPGMVGGIGIGMMSPQNMMSFGVQSNPVGNRNSNSNAMNSLSMSGMDMSAWTTGKK